MKSALFKVFSRAEETETNVQMAQELEAAIFSDDNRFEGCGWGISRRIDDDYIEVFIKTVDAAMDMILQDQRLELTKQLEGWPDESAIEQPE